MTFYNEKFIKKSRKVHYCEACGGVIPPGSSCVNAVGISYEGDFFSIYLHESCLNIYNSEWRLSESDSFPFCSTFEGCQYWKEYTTEQKNTYLNNLEKISNPSKIIEYAIKCLKGE